MTLTFELSLDSCCHLLVRFQDIEKENEKQNILQPPEKSGDDGTLAGLRNKEVMSLDIPLKESGSAGLGVSVKGKTQTNEHGQRDLGIFIKAVIHGGAASKVRTTAYV